MNFKKMMCVLSCVIFSSASLCLLKTNATNYLTMAPVAYLMVNKRNWDWASAACSMLTKWINIPDESAVRYVNLIAKIANKNHSEQDKKENRFRTLWAVRKCLKKLRKLKKSPSLKVKINHYTITEKEIYHIEHSSSEKYKPKSGITANENLKFLKTTKDAVSGTKDILKKYIIDFKVPCYVTIVIENKPHFMVLYGVVTDENENISRVLICSELSNYNLSIKDFCLTCKEISAISPDESIHF